MITEFESYCNNDLLPSSKAISTDVKITTEKIHTLPPLKQDKENPLEELLRKITGHNQTLGVAFGTEAGLFSKAGIPSVVYGPGFIDQAHKPNEFISIEQLEKCSDFIIDLARWAAK